MTAKRFILDEYFGIGSVVIDTENENVRFRHENKLSMKQCCDLLNELHEENKEFKSLLDKMSDCNNEIWLDDGRIYRLRKAFKGEWVK